MIQSGRSKTRISSQELIKRVNAVPSKAEAFRRNVLGFQDTDAGKLRVAKWAQLFAYRVWFNALPEDSTWLIFVGETGTGKTHLAKAIGRLIALHAVDLWKEGKWGKIPTVSVFDWSELVEKSDGIVFKDAVDTDLLVIDDLGAETDRFKSGQPTEILRRILGSREDRWTIITTNVEQADWPERWDARVASRMSSAQVVKFTGLPDFRKKTLKE